MNRSLLFQAPPDRPHPASVLGIGLSALLRDLQAAITTAFPAQRRVWVRAEVLQVKTVKGHLCLELAEHDGQGTLTARAAAWIWQAEVTALSRRFTEGTGGETLRAGLRVLLEVTVSYRPDKGLALRICDLDPTFTVGEMAARVAAIRARLVAEGVFDHNRRLPPPADFCRVAVLSPAQAAGLGDFRDGADRLAGLELCDFRYYTARFQGDGAAADIVNVLRQIYRDHRVQPFDALVLIRGGGAKADLYPLNDYDLAYALCRMPLPVLVGIGHEQDRTLPDEVAQQRFATPSKVIAHIRDHIVHRARQAAQDWQRLSQASQQQLERARSALDREQQRLQTGSRERLLTTRHQLDRLHADLAPA